MKMNVEKKVAIGLMVAGGIAAAAGVADALNPEPYARLVEILGYSDLTGFRQRQHTADLMLGAVGTLVFVLGYCLLSVSDTLHRNSYSPKERLSAAKDILNDYYNWPGWGDKR